MTVKTLKTALALVGLSLSFAASANAAFSPITLVSGNGTLGGGGTVAVTDSIVKFAAGPQTGDFVGPLPFASATNTAYVVPPNPGWTAVIGGAQWDSVASYGSSYGGTTALYAYTYTITSAPTSTLFLGGMLSSDDSISGIYIDGTLVSGPIAGTYTTATTLGLTALTAAESTVGSHTLYIDAVNQNPGTASGVLFSLTLTTVPEPSSIILVGLAGLVGVGYQIRRKRAIV
jgi:hypothetical protein